MDKIDIFTIKDIDKLKKALDKAGAKPIKPSDTIEFTPQEYIALEKIDRWATDILEKADRLNWQCTKN